MRSGHIRLAGWPAVAVVALAASALSWRPAAWANVAAGVDASWQAGLAEGFERHLQWGPQVIFTFGPYGLVDTILPFGSLTVSLAVLFAFATSWGLAALVVGALRPAWGLLPAGVVAWAALAIANSHTGYTDLASAAALGLALLVLRTDRSSRRLAALVLLGALAAFSLLAKFNDGIVASGLFVVVLAAEGAAYGGRAFRRAAGAGVVVFVGVFLAAWAGAGQSLGNLPSYFSGSVSIAAGYSSAMSLSEGRDVEDLFGVVVLALLALVFCLSAAFADSWARLGRRAQRARQAALVVSLAGWAWAAMKEGFVRHDKHDLTFFGLVLVAIGLARVGRRYLVVQACALAVAASLACVAAGSVPEQLRSPGASPAALAGDLRAATGLRGFAPARVRLHAELLAAGDGLPAKVLSLVRGHSVAIEPSDEAVAYLYPGLKWDPWPVLQGYSAYTDYLDSLGSKFLASSRAPARIVYEPKPAIDGRDPWLDPPGTVLSVYCHYRELAVVGPWQVLAHVADRCGRPRLMRTVRVPFGDDVAVPQARGEVVTATFSFGLPLVSKLEDVLLKPPLMSVMVWPAGPSSRGGGRRPEDYRFIPGTAGDMHVLRTPSSLGYAPAFTPPALRAVEIQGGGWPNGQGVVTVKLYALTLAPAR